jgi:hypothetical protein
LKNELEVDMSKKVKAVMLIVAILMLGSTIVYAGTSYEGYDTTVGSFHGSGYTGYQTKSTSGANGDLYSSEVGGDYVLSARMLEYDGTAYTNNIGDNNHYTLAGNPNHLAGESIKVHFRNNWTTPVNVQVRGSWRSN